MDFFHPGATQIPCGATNNAEYKVSLIPNISPTCHPNFPFVGGINSAYFTGLLLRAHQPGRGVNKCITGSPPISISYILYTRVEEIRELMKLRIADGTVFDAFLADDVLDRTKRKRRTGSIRLSPIHSHVTLISKLVS